MSATGSGGPSINAFVWSERFDTGIDSVDRQHKRLVELVNAVGDLLLRADEAGAAELQNIFKTLADYARFHFADEERVMTEGGIDPRHASAHKEHHRTFTEQVVAMWQTRESMSRPAETLHGFLTGWLSFHILGEDQVMARELRRIKEGMPAARAHEIESGRRERSTSALLQALQNLYGVLSLRNKDLATANRTLEARVAERTTQLDQAYAKLVAEHQELTELLQKVEVVQRQLMQAEKMASIGQLAAGVAHEINNPIGFVTSNLGTLERYCEQLLRVIDASPDTAEARQAAAEVDLPYLRADLPALLSESREGLGRVRKIVADLKDYSHVDEAEWQSADLLAGLESTLSVANHELKYKTELVRELNPLPRVRCIPAQINQVLLNLLVNAAQSIETRGRITLRSGREGDYAWLEIEDTGGGMTDAVRQRMFDPFFTTKPVGKGTGLGLSLSYDIIHKHGGHFDVASTPGQGTRIRIWLPVAGPDRGDAATDAPPGQDG